MASTKPQTGAATSKTPENQPQTQKITTFLWFDNNAEEAVNFYTSVFKNSKINGVTRYSQAGQEVHRRPPGSVMVVEFEPDGEVFTALNGGPAFTFNEAISLQIMCDTQQEIDYYWDKLSQGGDPKAQVCGWLKDRYGLSWQVVPKKLKELVKNHESPAAQRVMTVMLQMKKLDIVELEQAAAGAPSAAAAR